MIALRTYSIDEACFADEVVKAMVGFPPRKAMKLAMPEGTNACSGHFGFDVVLVWIELWDPPSPKKASDNSASQSLYTKVGNSRRGHRR
jgi:hypothetical protein